MTTQDITNYVNGLSIADVRRFTATDVMGWKLGFRGREMHEYEVYESPDGYIACEVISWLPDIDRNQSRQLTDKVYSKDPSLLYESNKALSDSCELMYTWWLVTPLNESRAALIAYYIHKESEREREMENNALEMDVYLEIIGHFEESEKS